VGERSVFVLAAVTSGVRVNTEDTPVVERTGEAITPGVGSVPTALVSEFCGISGWILSLPALAGAVQADNKKHKTSASPRDLPGLYKISPRSIKGQTFIILKTGQKKRAARRETPAAQFNPAWPA